MREIRLRTFAHVSFHKSEETNFNEFIRTKYGASIGMRKGEGVMFISKGGDQYVIVEPPEDIDTVLASGKKVHFKVIASQRFRIRGAKWSPEMLSVYGERAGYRIVGIKRFEWYLKERVLEQRAA
jgi:hypothetical protein